jgi:hypothetical protein
MIPLMFLCTLSFLQFGVLIGIFPTTSTFYILAALSKIVDPPQGA